MGRLYVIGIGPGEYEQMTVKAVNAMNACDLIVGYTVYVDLVKEHFPGKEFFTTPMTKEVDRCKHAINEAVNGRNVAIICSGDAGVYGMSGLIFELIEEMNATAVDVEVIPGVTAALSGGAVLGAPLTHDFAVISLSDRLTAWETIEARLKAAAKADLSIAIYNPSSKGRPDYLKRACEILLEDKAADTVCGYVMQIGRDGECARTCTLAELKNETVDMFTTVFIGNKNTRIIGGKMVTPRGYRY